MKIATLWVILFLGFLVPASAQEIYRTKHGDIAIGITIHDSTVLLISNELSVALDYESSKVSFKVPVETFVTRIDSLDSKLRAQRGNLIEFSGKVGITINTQNFAPQRYNLEGQVTSTSPPVPVRGNGSMNCIPAGDRATPACTFLLNFETTLTALHLREAFPGAAEGVRIEVRQSILERDNE